MCCWRQVSSEVWAFGSCVVVVVEFEEEGEKEPDEGEEGRVNMYWMSVWLRWKAALMSATRESGVRVLR